VIAHINLVPPSTPRSWRAAFSRRSRAHLNRVSSRRQRPRQPLREAAISGRDLVRMHVELFGSASDFSPLIAAKATFALKAGLWFRRGLFVMLSPVHGSLRRVQAEFPLIQGVQISRASSLDPRGRRQDRLYRARWSKAVALHAVLSCRCRRGGSRWSYG
jgi:hypothetical protein